jgi:hypothetical protein
MSEAKARGASAGRPPGVIDMPASGEAVIRLLPAASSAETASAVDEEALRRLVQLPKDAGWVLIAAGVVGLVVPGIPGTPFLLAGAAVVVPGGPRLLSRWLGRNPPRIVHSAVRQIGRFIDDLERRYPRR